MDDPEGLADLEVDVDGGKATMWASTGGRAPCDLGPVALVPSMIISMVVGIRTLAASAAKCSVVAASDAVVPIRTALAISARRIRCQICSVS